MGQAEKVELEYAQEVYAACGTVGYDAAGVRRLKALIDARETSSSEPFLLLAFAQQVQIECVEWAGSRSPPKGP